MVALLAIVGPSQAAVAVRVLLGVGDQAETDWSGGDAMLPGNRWKMTWCRIRLFGAAARPPAANAPRLQFAPITPVNRPFSASLYAASDVPARRRPGHWLAFGDWSLLIPWRSDALR